MDPVLQPAEIDRRGLDTEALKRAFLERLVYSVGKDPESAKDHDWYEAVALAVARAGRTKDAGPTHALRQKDHSIAFLKPQEERVLCPQLQDRLDALQEAGLAPAAAAADFEDR